MQTTTPPFTSQLFRSPSGASQLDHLAPEGRRIRRSRFRHSGYLLPKGLGVHEIGSTPNIGWSTKLARRYLRHVGAETEPIKAWAVHALRCMFGVNKPREDLRNHAVDAFLVAHFDRFVLKPAFDWLRHQYAYEVLYKTRALQDALSGIGGGSGSSLYEDLVNNLDRLKAALPNIATAHRADNQWNPDDSVGGGLGAFGKENIYSFRPTRAERVELTLLLRNTGIVPDDEAILTGKEILDRFDTIYRDTREGQRLVEKLAGKIELRYLKRSGDQSRRTLLKRRTALPLSNQKGAFINAEGKFAIVGAPRAKERLVLSIADFSRRSAEERANVFATREPIYRRGDTVVKDGGAFVVTGLQHDKRLIVYPINESEREKKWRKLITISPDMKRIASSSRDATRTTESSFHPAMCWWSYWRTRWRR